MTTLPLAATDLLRALDAGRAAAIEAIAGDAEAGDAHALAAAEADAATLERATDPGAFARVEHVLNAARAAGRRAAEARLQALVAAGDARFRSAFDLGRALLGTAWPLGAEASAPPPASRPAAEATAT